MHVSRRRGTSPYPNGVRDVLQDAPTNSAGRTKKTRPAHRITLDEITTAFNGPTGIYPPILSLKEAAVLAHITPGTLKRKVSEGNFPTSACRGKPLRFWRDRFVYELMNKGR